jgi:hypothetical protein
MLRVLFVILALGALPSLASAEGRKISGKHGVGEIRNACSKAGGTFSVHDDGAGYGCNVKNCDGKGGNCTVACDNNGNCHGSTPGRILPGTAVTGVLSGTTSAGVLDSGSTTPVKPKATRAPQPGAVKK